MSEFVQRDPVLEAVALDVLLEHASPPRDFSYRWRVFAREDGVVKAWLDGGLAFMTIATDLEGLREQAPDVFLEMEFRRESARLHNLRRVCANNRGVEVYR